jgi:hypothetical protein
MCSGGAAVACDDKNPCTGDSCDKLNGCQTTPLDGPCDDGSACTVGDSCTSGVCGPGKGNDCDDKSLCTKDSCDATAGCKNAPVTCDDGNPCTVDSCDPAKGCVATSKPEGTECKGASCEGGVFTSAATCQAGQCVPGTAKTCADSNPCTDDVCDPAKGCSNPNNTAPCSDNSACTAGDACSNGACVPGKAVVCDDGNVCTAESCDPGKGCQSVAAKEGASCIDTVCDGLSFVPGSVCSAGVCTKSAAAKSCVDGNVCTDDACNPTSGCVNTLNTAPCDDGSPCTKVDTCAGGLCKGGSNVDCNDDNPCTTDTCNKLGNCDHVAVPDASKCGDVGVCLAGVCSPGSDINPAASCKAIKQVWAAAPTGVYWLDPDGKGAGLKYQVFCEQVKNGGGWMAINNAWAHNLLNMVNGLPAQGGCLLSATEWRSWDGFAGAPGPSHLCTGVAKSTNWPTYSEIFFDAVKLTGYTAGADVFDLGTNCASTDTVGYFCAGPANGLAPPNTVGTTLKNGVAAVYSRTVTLAAPTSSFLIRSRESGTQDEGIIWNSGTIFLR